MDGLRVILTILLGVVSCSHDAVSVSALEVTVNPGDNITLYCDCKVSIGVYIVWFKNCSHENQPSLVLRVKDHYSSESAKKFPRLTFEKNDSSESYDLVIVNTTKSDEGLYYCGTEQTIVNSKDTFDSCKHGNITTSLRLYSCEVDPDSETILPGGGLCSKLLFALIPAVSIFFMFLSLFVVYLLSRKTVTKNQDDENDDIMGQTEEKATLKTLESQQRTKKMRTTQTSDFSTCTTVKYSSNVKN